MQALLTHPYAADDLVNSPAWPSFCRSLETVLADPDPETSGAAVTFAESVFREVKGSKPHELADLCITVCAHISSEQCSMQQASGLDAGVSQTGRASCSRSAGSCSMQGQRQSPQCPAEEVNCRTAVRTAVLRLLLQCLRALPRVWATFRDPMLQRLWDAVCPLLRLDICSSVRGSLQQTDSNCRDCEQQSHARAAGADAPSAGGLSGALLDICLTEGWRGDWWAAWIASARPARVGQLLFQNR